MRWKSGSTVASERVPKLAGRPAKLISHPAVPKVQPRSPWAMSSPLASVQGSDTPVNASGLYLVANCVVRDSL